MKALIKWAFKAFQYVDHRQEAGIFECLAGINRALTATADQQNRPLQITLDQTFYLVRKFRVYCPIWRFLSGNMLSPDRMSDVHELNLGTTINQHGLCLFLQEYIGVTGSNILHGEYP